MASVCERSRGPTSQELNNRAAEQSVAADGAKGEAPPLSRDVKVHFFRTKIEELEDVGSGA